MPNTPDELATISKMLEGMEQRLNSKIESAVGASEQRIEGKTEGLEKRLERKIETAVEASERRITEDMGNLFEKTWELIDENKKKFEEHISIAHKN